VQFLVRSDCNLAGRDRHGRILRNLATLVDTGKLQLLIDDTHFTLETVADAHRRIESGSARPAAANRPAASATPMLTE
jgi:hypothetical protein